MPDLPRQEPIFGGGLKAAIAHVQMPARSGEQIDEPGASIGEYLRQNRERRGKTLADISRALKILPHQLAAIERDAFEELPGRAYAIGYVRSYASFLGLDARALVAKLKAELTGPDMEPVFAAPNPVETSQSPGHCDADGSSANAGLRPEYGWIAGAPQKALQLKIDWTVLRFKEITKYASELKRGLSSPARPTAQTRSTYGQNLSARGAGPALFSAPRRAPLFSIPERSVPQRSPSDHPVRNWVTAGLMGATIIYFGFSILHSGVNAPPPVTAVPARLAAEAAFIPEKIAPPAGVTPEQSVPSAPAPAAVPPVQDESHEAAAVEKSATTSRQAAIAPAQPDSVTYEPKHVLRDQLPLGERYGEQNRGSRVTLRVHRATLVAVLGMRNHQYIDRVLRAGDTYRVPNMRGLKLSTRDAGAVEVILDGNTVGFAGQDGLALKGMSLQPQSIVSRFHWTQE